MMAKYQRLTREESKAQTRERLLEAARHVFARGGYAGAGVDAIALEAGFSKGAFYSNFETKEAIFLELLSRHMAAEAEQLEQLVVHGSDSDDLLNNLDSWLEHLDADVDWALLSVELQLHARRSTDFAVSYDALLNRHCEKLGGMIERLFDMSGKQVPVPAHQLALALVTLAHGLVLQKTQINDGSGVSAGHLMRTILRSLVSAAD